MSTTPCEVLVGEAPDLGHVIVTELAERTDAEPTTLPPLYEAIDPQALNELFRGDRSGRVRFEYAGYEVTVDGTERVRIDDGEGPRARSDSAVPQVETQELSDSGFRLHCGACGWNAAADDSEPEDASRRAIEHFVETDHSPIRRIGSADG
ncbi:HalOD1 output domain-containing protein [Natronococcus sp. JC468]|uniref:HalOD1 output domain-containing protein n=1 Tax=Natronococcus sp. JC468 TaxID=1961921 RepID=UPI001ADFE377|nr:HalOD1 output domain-containing protein [Natronococcus sp. JC468]